MVEPTPAPAVEEYTPTKEELREIADFIQKRSEDEAREAGRMQYFREVGITVQVQMPAKEFSTPARQDEARKKVEEWLAEHSPDRFSDLAYRVASLSEAVASAGISAVYERQESPDRGPHRIQTAWFFLVRAARLWEQHPEFKPLWVEEGEPAG